MAFKKLTEEQKRLVIPQVRIDKKLDDALAAVSEKTGLSVCKVVRYVLSAVLVDQALDIKIVSPVQLTHPQK